MDPQIVEITLVGMSGITQEGLRRILITENFQVQCLSRGEIEGTTGTRSFQVADRLSIFVISGEIGQIGSDTVMVCEKLRRSFPSARVVILADTFDYDDVVRAFIGGVDGYIINSISCETLFIQLKLIAMGAKVLPSQIANNLHRHTPISTSRDWISNVHAATLSSREVDTLICISRGMANKVISRVHNITEATVKVHVKAILRKLQVSNRTQAAIWAVQHGFDSSSWQPDEAELAAVNGETEQARSIDCP